MPTIGDDDPDHCAKNGFPDQENLQKKNGVSKMADVGSMPMKLIIQIPCYNESDTLAVTLGDLPRQIPGFSRVEWLLIDDGSTDESVAIAKAHGVDHIVRLPKRQGLARVFMAGLDACIKLGADVIVNTDADNQYKAEFIPKLVAPVVDGSADMVIGARSISQIRQFSRSKKILQRIGSWVVRKFSRTTVPDAPSGFRALSRDAAMRINVFNDFTYTLETIIQAGQKNMAIISIPIEVNPTPRPSRLIKGVFPYIKRSLVTIVRISIIYKPFSFFFTIGLGLFFGGFLIGLRFLWFLLHGTGRGHVQSLILASILLGMGVQSMLIAFISDLLSTNRKILEDLQYRMKKMEYQEKEQKTK